MDENRGNSIKREITDCISINKGSGISKSISINNEKLCKEEEYEGMVKRRNIRGKR